MNPTKTSAHTFQVGPTQSTQSQGGKVNVALTGTSNCVFLNGLSYGILNHPAVLHFLNKSQGASGTAALASHLQNFDLSNFHYVFIEYCINESAMLANGTQRIETTYNHIAATIDFSAAQGCTPIFVNLPTVHSIGQSRPMLEMLKHEFVSRGVPLFDVQQILESRAKARGLDVRECFHDPLHLERVIAFAFGTVMLNCVERARASKAFQSSSETTSAEFCEIGFVPAETLICSDASPIFRKNRLLSANLLNLLPDQYATIPQSASGSRVIRGVSYNAARSLGSLISNENEPIIKVNRNKLFGTERDLSLISRPSSLSNITISREMQFRYEAGMPVSDDLYPMGFELAGFTVDYPDRHRLMRVISVDKCHRLLHETVTADDLDLIDAACDKVIIDRAASTKVLEVNTPTKESHIDDTENASHLDTANQTAAETQLRSQEYPNGVESAERKPTGLYADSGAAWAVVELLDVQKRNGQFRPFDGLTRWPHHVEAATHQAFGLQHLAAETSAITTAPYPIMWSMRAQFPHGPILRFGNVIVTPAPHGGNAIYPMPANAVPRSGVDAELNVTINCGQSLSVWSNSGGPKGQAWTAQLEWGGIPVDPRLMMFNGGILAPGIRNGRLSDPSAQAEFVPARDELIDPIEAFDRNGFSTGRLAHRHSTSPAIAYMIRRAFGADGCDFGTNWMCVAVGMGAKGIDYFLPRSTGGGSDWFNDVFEPTVVNVVAASRSYRVRKVDIAFEHGEADSQDMTRTAYRLRLDRLTKAACQTVSHLTGQAVVPVFIQTQIGTPLLSKGAFSIGRKNLEINDVALAILDKGLSLSEENLNYLCAGPRYDLTFVGISHLDHFGYLHNDERRAYILNEHERQISEGTAKKWLPAHVKKVRVDAIEPDQSKERRYRLILDCHVPFAPLRVDTVLIPRKPNFGFQLMGGSKAPEITNCQISADGTSVILDLSDAWTGPGRVVGVATKASKGRQGWLTDNETPEGLWQHVGVACNIHDSAPWSSSATGQLLPNWLCSQYVELPDEEN